MTYIADPDIFDRAVLNGMNSRRHNYTDRSNHLKMAEQQLQQEHIWQCLEWHDDALAALTRADAPADDISSIADLLMQGMEVEHEEVTNGTDFYYHDWEISPLNTGDWKFSNNFNGSAFCDSTLLTGLEICRDMDQDLTSLTERFARDLSLIQEIRLKQLVEAAIQHGVNGGLLVAERIMDEMKQSVAFAER